MTIFTTFVRIKKWSNCECLEEHLKSSVTELVMGGPIVRNLCVGRNRETNQETKS